jgi:cell division protein FtsI (penicillin-binding protein 3)
VAIGFVLTLFAGRLIQIQGMEGSAYKALAEQERLKTSTVPALRGSITGSNGQILAMTIEKYTIIADPQQIGDKTAAARELAGPLGLSAAQILRMLDHPAGAEYQVLASGVSVANEAKIAGMTGITANPVYSRVYPDGDATANVVGFTSQNSAAGEITGEQGIEEADNKLLAGTAGSEEYETGLDGQEIPGTELKATQAVDGDSIRLTINPTLQFQAEQACQQRVQQLQARNCTAVIMQPQTGDILAMAQWPTYSQSDVTSIAQTTDIPIENVFQPGSTAKVISAAAAFEHGGQTPLSAYSIPCSGYIVEGGQEIHDAEDDACSHYTIAGVIAHSSNIGMSQVVTHISAQTQYDYLRDFGLDEPTGLNLPGESDGILPVPGSSDYYWDTKYTLSYGQGVAVNAVQMASVYATIANGGVRVQPRLIEGTTSASGKYTPAAPSPSRRVIQAKTAKQLISILQQVPPLDASADGDAGVLNGYAVAGKTGTSNETGPECPASNQECEYGSSFIGMAPGNNPQVVVSVNVQDPGKNLAFFGDEVAGPVLNTVLKDTLADLQIPPQLGLQPANVRLSAP